VKVVDGHLFDQMITHGAAGVLAVTSVVLALANRRQYKDNRTMTDRYIAKHEKLAEMQQETLRMQNNATLAVREAAHAIAQLRSEIEDKNE